MDVKNRRVTIMGLGSFGGGVGVARFLARRGARVIVTDLKPAEELGPSLAALDDVSLRGLYLGGHRDDDFISTDLVVANPAVAIENPYLQLARRHGIPVTSEIALFFRCVKSPIIGVTGSNGKSTTSALIHAVLQATGNRAWLGGNIGGSLLESLDDISPEDPIVLELSSFQLEYLAAERLSPHVAVVTNFAPNHLDRHGTLDAYRAAKQNLLRFQTAGDVAILNDDDAAVRRWPVAPGVELLRFGFRDSGLAGAFLDEGDRSVVFRDSAGQSRRFGFPEAFPLPGRHNVANALAALTCAFALGVDESVVRRGLVGFQGLPHRLQRVAEIEGRVFYNDSISTTPESSCAALDAFESSVILIAGGYDKEVNLQALSRRAFERAKAVALIGRTGPTLKQQFDTQSKNWAQHAPARSSGPEATLAGDLETAVAWAWQHSLPGDVVVLSPGCASYDQFRNFEHRGETFRELVHRLRESVTSNQSTCA